MLSKQYLLGSQLQLDLPNEHWTFSIWRLTQNPGPNFWEHPEKQPRKIEEFHQQHP